MNGWKQPPKRILFLFVTMPVGGAEMLCFHFLNGLDRSRFQPLVCCIRDLGELGLEIRRAGHEVVSLGGMRSRRFEPGTVLALANLLKSREIDIIHTNMYHANLYGRLAALTLGRRKPKIVTALHSLYTRRKPYRLLVSGLLNRWTDRVIVVSRAVWDDLLRYERVDTARVELLPPGIDWRRFESTLTAEDAKARLELSASDWVLGTVGRLVEVKGHRYLLEAARILKDRGVSCRLIVVGGGPLEEDLRRRSIELGIQDRVLFLGTRRDLADLYRAMDVFVMASVSEAASVAVVEAMSAGLPCVVTSVGGTVDLVDGGRVGVLVPPADPRAMADAIERLRRSPEECARLGRAAGERSRSLYSVEGMVRNLESIYDGLFFHNSGSGNPCQDPTLS